MLSVAAQNCGFYSFDAIAQNCGSYSFDARQF